MSKPWVKTQIFNHCDQLIEIEPNEDRTGIQISIGEADGRFKYERFYINPDELDTIINHLKSAMEDAIK